MVGVFIAPLQALSSMRLNFILGWVAQIQSPRPRSSEMQYRGATLAQSTLAHWLPSADPVRGDAQIGRAHLHTAPPTN